MMSLVTSGSTDSHRTHTVDLDTLIPCIVVCLGSTGYGKSCTKWTLSFVVLDMVTLSFTNLNL